MLRVLLAWSILDVIAVIALLYDYQSWYGHRHRAAVARRQSCKKNRITMKRQTGMIAPYPALAKSAEGQSVEKLVY